MSQLSASEILESMRGLKVKESQEEELLTSCQLKQYQSPQKLASAKSNFNDKRALFLDDSKVNIFKKQIDNNSMFDSSSQKSHPFLDLQGVCKTFVFDKTKQSFFKKPKPLATKQLIQIANSEVQNSCEQVLQEQVQNKQKQSDNNTNQKQIFNKTNIFRVSNPFKTEFKNPFAFDNIQKSNDCQFEIKSKQQQKFKSKKQTNTSQTQQSNNEQSNDIKSQNLDQNIVKDEKYHSDNQIKLTKIFEKIQKQKILMGQKLKKDVSTNFIEYYNSNYSKLKLRNPGRKTYQLVNIALQNFKSKQTLQNKS